MGYASPVISKVEAIMNYPAPQTAYEIPWHGRIRRKILQKLRHYESS